MYHWTHICMYVSAWRVLCPRLVPGMLLWTVTRGRRNNRAAPKDSRKPFCILFTDIQFRPSLPSFWKKGNPTT